jgi:hypothetical protein
MNASLNENTYVDSYARLVASLYLHRTIQINAACSVNRIANLTDFRGFGNLVKVSKRYETVQLITNQNQILLRNWDYRETFVSSAEM